MLTIFSIGCVITLMATYNYDDFSANYALKSGSSLISNRALAGEWEVSEATIRRWKKKYEDETDAFLEATIGSKGSVRASKALASFESGLPRPMEYFGSPLITGDVHIPLTSMMMTAIMYEKRRQNNIADLILGGDFWNNDGLGRFDPKQLDHTLEQEWDIGREYFGALLDEFENVYIIKGNHDDRFPRALGYKVGFVEATKLLLGKVYEDNAERIHISPLDHMYVYGKEGQKYYVCHPKAYSRSPLATGRALAAKHHCNIICAHAHHHAVGTDISGQYVVAEMGGLFDANKAAYLHEATTFPKQVNGLCWLDPNGRLVAWNPLFEFAT